jgi:ribosomal protein S28E/S33
MLTLRLLAITTLSATALAAQTVIPVGQFQSIELHDGGNVIVRHGTSQRVTILTGSLRCARVRIMDGQRLFIHNSGGPCREDDRLQIEVVTPAISAVSVSNGGTLQTLGSFPAQETIEADVEQGGTIDIRSMSAAAVHASVFSGGRIFTTPRETLAGTVTSGGVITYWGSPHVKKSVRGGGVVQRGASADAVTPLSDLDPGLPAIPPLPPLPPVLPIPPR